MKQQSLASQAMFEKYDRKSRRELFLEEMEGIVPRSAMGALLRRRTRRPSAASAICWRSTIWAV